MPDSSTKTLNVRLSCMCRLRTKVTGEPVTLGEGIPSHHDDPDLTTDIAAYCIKFCLFMEMQHGGGRGGGRVGAA